MSPVLSENQLATFYLDGYRFGVEVCQVQEVLRYQEMTQVPLAPSVVRGLINLRGQIVTAIDLRRRLSMPAREDDQQAMNVVVRRGQRFVSLLVDQIGDVLMVDENQVEVTPQNVDRTLAGLIKGVVKMDDELLLVLDVEAALNIAEST